MQNIYGLVTTMELVCIQGLAMQSQVLNFTQYSEKSAPCNSARDFAASCGQVQRFTWAKQDVYFLLEFMPYCKKFAHHLIRIWSRR